jgi:nitrogen fixation protein FixH
VPLKVLICGLHAFFALLLAATFYLASRAYDGLVEEGYFREAQEYLTAREGEETLGLSIRVPGMLSTGANRFAAVVSTVSGPLRGASADLRAMRISGPGEDRVVALREEEPGVYAGELLLPSPGRWLMRLSVDGDEIRTRRRWFVTAVAGGAASLPDAGIHGGPVAAFAGDQAVILEIAPRPVAAMEELRFTVSLPGHVGPGAPRIDLSMPGMRMPPNRVELERDQGGAYRGTGVLVRCSSGRRTWQAAVDVPGKGKAVFTFDVAP